MPDPRELLARERATVVARLAVLGGEFERLVAAADGSNLDDEHDPEGATIAFERSQLDALVRQAESHLADVDAALDRLARGAYGVCESCGGPVPDARLAARPTARTCVTCPAG